VQRLKIMAKLDIAEKRRPQDGKIRFRGPMGTIELRVATIPTAGGNEDVVMRILAASKPLPLDRMGFLERNLSEFKTILHKPYGSAWSWVRRDLARRRRCTRLSASSTPRT